MFLERSNQDNFFGIFKITNLDQDLGHPVRVIRTDENMSIDFCSIQSAFTAGMILGKTGGDERNDERIIHHSSYNNKKGENPARSMNGTHIAESHR